MKHLEVFDPAMCCSTGVCGPEVEPELVQFAALLADLQKSGVRVERHNLAQQPIAFARNEKVKSLLNSGGAEVLPLIFADGELLLQGAYPDHAQRTAWRIAMKEHAQENGNRT